MKLLTTQLSLASFYFFILGPTIIPASSSQTRSACSICSSLKVEAASFAPIQNNLSHKSVYI